MSGGNCGWYGRVVCREEAAGAYQQVLTQQTGESGLYDLTLDALAGLARVRLAQDDPAEALAYVEEILSAMETKPADQMAMPFLICLTCYRVLEANGDHRAQATLEAAYHLLKERKAKLGTEEQRQRFMENVPTHREIVQEFEGNK